MAARARAVRVRILLPGPHIDSFTVNIVSKQVWGDLLPVGVEIDVYQPTMLHTKLVVIDEEFVSVGSTNLRWSKTVTPQSLTRSRTSLRHTQPRPPAWSGRSAPGARYSRPVDTAAHSTS